MPTENPTSSHDPRDRLVREKYFSLRPKPLERYLWQQGLPQAAERVFWLHWEEGMRNRDWCSEVPLKRVAALCCIDTSTVTRAYQVLKGLGEQGIVASICPANTRDSAASDFGYNPVCLLYTSPSPRDRTRSRMPSSA